MKIQYDPRVHACYEPIRKAVLETSDWRFVTVRNPEIIIGRARLSFPGLRQCLHLVTHFILALRLVRHAAKRHVFVREFITVPLLVFLPIWWPFRARIFFLNNHNFQFAHHKRVHRLALKFLLWAGARIVGVELSLREAIGFRGRKNDVVIPFPSNAGFAFSGPGPANETKVKVGVLTSFRGEQQAEELIESLSRAAPGGGWDLVVASHYHAPLARVSHLAGEVWPLQSDEDYWKAIARFDVIVFHYARHAYEYRTSGIIADAIACGVPIICPNYPVIAHQIQWPAPMGLVYQDLSEVPELIRQVSRWPKAELREASRLHQAYRGQQAYVGILSDLKNGAEGDLCQTR